MYPNQENFYWLFSSSAQTISAFVAFLVAGYAVVLNMMESIEKKDDTLDDLHSRLKIKFYINLRLLAIVTGLAILMSLWMIYLNAGTNSNKYWLFILTILLNSIAIIVGIFFIISIINPNKYKNAAKEIIKKDKKEFKLTGKRVDQLTFMNEFVELEKIGRDILHNKQLFNPFDDTRRIAYSFRQMIIALFQNKLISPYQFNDLIRINKYRNLVFHGQQDEVDAGMVDLVMDLINQLSKTK
jgi:hypothetical protein